MNKTKIFLFALVTLLAASCMRDTIDQGALSAEEAMVARKFINTVDSAVPGELIIYVDKASVAMLEGVGEATRVAMTDIEQIADEVGAYSIEPVFNLKVNAERKRALGMDRWYAVSLPENVDLESVARSFASLESVERVEFNMAIEKPSSEAIPFDGNIFSSTRASVMPFNDERIEMQWSLNNTAEAHFYPTVKAGEDINVLPAWELTTGRPDIIVAVVDSGVCYTHPDLKDNMWVNEAELNGADGVDDDGNGYVDDIYGYNFADNMGRIMWSAKDSHGTHVAGIIGATSNNGIGIAGIAGGSGNGDGVRIMSSQIMSGSNTAGVKSIGEAIEYAADNGASILQCSWGFKPGDYPSDVMFESGSASAEYQALQYFISTSNCPAMDGGLVVFAAGNEGMPLAGYPAAYNDYLSVTAFAPDGLPTYYTCYDKGCNISAPGGEYYFVGNSMREYGCILSTLANGDYGYMQGTSQACPHVSGIAALGLSYALDNGLNFTLAEFKSKLLTSVNNFDSVLVGTKENVGTGGTLNLNNYRGKMGTGKVDTYRFLMSLRGTACIPVAVGQEVIIDFNKYMGDGETSIKVLSKYTISDETRATLGIEGERMIGDKFIITCTKPGCGTITVSMVAGGTAVGGGQLVGGMAIEKEFALVAREGNTVGDSGMVEDAAGWL
ncbi:MAG: S8 family serine peptidase [Alistipes sp.]|nr:S8 family serine peptidase [Alistipes sp.]